MPPLKMTQESALIFPFLNKSDSGTYGCTATSNMGSYKAYYTLNVNGEPPPSTPHSASPSPESAPRHARGQVSGQEPAMGGPGPRSPGPLWNV